MQAATSLPTPGPATASGSRRFLSVDALRGFDMLWIVGAGGLVHALDRLAGSSDTGFLHLLSTQLSHKEWAGFAFYDLIFPLFVFLVGVSIVFSLSRAATEGGKGAAYLRRFVVLYIVALLYPGGFSKLWPDIRLMGVLNRIALCYLFTSLAFLALSPRGLAGLLILVLGGYWAMMTFVEFPDVRPRDAAGKVISERVTARDVSELDLASTHRIRGVFEPGLNLAHYIDQKFLPGKKWDGTWDPEGLLSTIPAIGTCLLGVFAGLLIRAPGLQDQRKVLVLAGAGVLSVGLGFLWGLQFPVIKKIWTSSYVLVAGGYSALLLAMFHQVIEVWKIRWWTPPFLWVGSNSITIYLANNVIGFGTLAKRFAGGNVAEWLDAHVAKGTGDLVLSVVAVGIGLALVGFLYRRRIFLRI
jgi:predicted acyltransferase